MLILKVIQLHTTEMTRGTEMTPVIGQSAQYAVKKRISSRMTLIATKPSAGVAIVVSLPDSSAIFSVEAISMMKLPIGLNALVAER